jgi:NADPH2:quinone reductase
MKAICVREFGGPEVLKLEDQSDLRPPQPGEVLIRVKAAGVNPYDTYMRSGAYGTGNPALPFTPGSDAAGVVESVGADVGLTLGDRVYTTGTITGAYAELALCKRSQVHPLPERVSYAQGAGVFACTRQGPEPAICSLNSWNIDDFVAFSKMDPRALRSQLL